MRKINEIKNTRNLFIEAENDNDGFGGHYYDSISGKRLNFIFSYQLGWEHLSVSMPNKTPTWDQMCIMKDIFWNKDECCVQYHPKEEDYDGIGTCYYPDDILEPKDPKILYDYIIKLQEKINTYENPEDLTLMFMYCNEKAKDKIKELQNKIHTLEDELEWYKQECDDLEMRIGLDE